MWDFRQLRWLNYCGWWPSAAKTPLGYRVSRVLGLCLYVSDFAQILPELISLYLEMAKGSLKGTVLNLSTTLMGVMCALKVGSIILRESVIQRLIDKFKEMEDEVREVLPPDVMDEIGRRRTNYAKITTYCTIPLISACVHWTIRPIWLIFQGQKVQVIEAWFPGDLEDNTYWTFIWVNQALHVVTAMFGFLIFDSIAYCLLESLLLMMYYLEAALVRLDFTPPGVDAHSPITLRFCVLLNVRIIAQKRKLNNLISSVILIQTVCNTIVFCLSVFELSSIKGTTLVKVVNLCEMIGLSAYSEYLYCFLCQEITNENVKVTQAAYANNWYQGKPKDKRALGILVQGWQREFKFGFIIQADLQTFIAMIKSSFTYFNFLKAISGEELVAA